MKPRVLVAMSGGVDSSVAAAVLLEAGYHVEGVTMKLWGGASDTGCCSVSDVEDARWVADQIGVEHHVFNFGDEFEHNVVNPYIHDHLAGRTPNPCVECNRHIKFDRLMQRADALSFNVVATGHHARIVNTSKGCRLTRGADDRKDQSYVLHMLKESVLQRLLFPVGDMTKTEVRNYAETRGLLTAAKPDSQGVCFITEKSGRKSFLGDHIPLRPGRVVDTSGATVGAVESIEMVAVGQRRKLGIPGGSPRLYVLDVDPNTTTVLVGDQDELNCSTTPLDDWSWVDEPFTGLLEVQTTAHGIPELATIDLNGTSIRWNKPHRAVAPGQSVVGYVDDIVVGGGTAGRPTTVGRYPPH